MLLLAWLATALHFQAGNPPNVFAGLARCPSVWVWFEVFVCVCVYVCVRPFAMFRAGWSQGCSLLVPLALFYPVNHGLTFVT